MLVSFVEDFFLAIHDVLFSLQSGCVHVGDQLISVGGESLQDVSYNEVSRQTVKDAASTRPHSFCQLARTGVW